MGLLNLSNRERGCSPRCFDLTKSDYTVCVICGDKPNMDTIGTKMFVLLINVASWDAFNMGVLN